MSLKRMLVLTVAIYTSICAAQGATYWLHVRVQSPEKAEGVKVNVPLNLIQTVLPAIDDENLKQGRVKLDSEELTVPQMRAIWETIKSEGSYELASIDSGEDRVRIALEGDELFVRSTEGSGTQVLISIPVSVVDALLSGDEDELDLQAGIEALQTVGAKELVAVNDGESTVRIWIDEVSTSE